MQLDRNNEEIANYLLNRCFIIGSIEEQRKMYFHVLNHSDYFSGIFQPLGYTLVINRTLKTIQLVNAHELGRVEFLKYDSILLLILRMLYIEKREGLEVNDHVVVVTVEDIQQEYQKIGLKRKLDIKMLDSAVRLFGRYNLASKMEALTELEARVQIFPSIMFVLPDQHLNEAYEKTKAYLALYSSESGDEEDE